MFAITSCPTCGSKKIHKVRRDWQGEYESQKYVVKHLEFYECPACGEKLYDRDAMRKIEACSPAFVKSTANG
jgi:YgiT-type zinc finger domain-containing protein